MSSYLGFEPTTKAGYYFVSYNTEDADRVSTIVCSLMRNDVPLWYDYGIEYGDQWAPQINEKLSKSQAVLLFFTKGILQKANSYVKKEYKMATEYLDKKVYIVLLDEIKPQDVPINMLDWWIDISSEQCINAYSIKDETLLIATIKKALGIETQEKRMNLLFENYKHLFESGKNEEAEQYFAEYLSGNAMKTRAKWFLNIASKSSEGILLDKKYFSFCDYEYEKSPIYQNGREWEEVSQGFRNGLGEKTPPHAINIIVIDGVEFKLGNLFLFHRGSFGDAHAIQLQRDGEVIYSLGGLIEVSEAYLYYDKNDDILYIAILSEKEEIIAGDCSSTPLWSCVTISNPKGAAIATKFEF